MSRATARFGAGHDRDRAAGGNGAWAGLALLPILCCAGPFIVAALAAASAVTEGLVAGLVAAALGGFLIVLVRRRSRTTDACGSRAPRRREVRDARP